MLGVSGLITSSGDGAAAGSGGSSEGGASGNRWPRQETMALLKIRSEMDAIFRDSSAKGPLWEEVSRKMAELGFQRSAKKCKEKFENVYKYHKRTKEGRASKSDGKTYRFFDQLAALESIAPPPATAPPPMPTNTTVSSSACPSPVSMVLPMQIPNLTVNNPSSSFQSLQPQPPPHALNANPVFQQSDSTSSDEDIRQRKGRKRKWKVFFQSLMKDVVQKQEELLKMFLDTLEKRERDRIAREDSWRMQETARMNREHELLVKEKSIAAAKDAAVIAFLQKVAEQQNLQIPISLPMQVKPPEIPPQPTTDNIGSDHSRSTSSSRWPKAEVQALIDLRRNLDLTYQESGPKGPFWEEISAGMAKLGYNRSSKRCKEKWENINKYFKKVKEGNKKRMEDSKTCPYFHQLDAIYKEKAKNDVVSPSFNPNPMPPIMAWPEQQWPLSDQQPSPDQPDDNNSDNNSDGEDTAEEDEEVAAVMK